MTMEELGPYLETRANFIDAMRMICEMINVGEHTLLGADLLKFVTDATPG